MLNITLFMENANKSRRNHGLGQKRLNSMIYTTKIKEGLKDICQRGYKVLPDVYQKAVEYDWEKVRSIYDIAKMGLAKRIEGEWYMDAGMCMYIYNEASVDDKVQKAIEDGNRVLDDKKLPF